MDDTLTQRAYQALRDRLRAGQLPPGARLVNRKLAAELGISFTPVREAIGRLASEGLVEHVPGAGAFVRRPDRRGLAQLYDLRALLEPHAAGEAALLATAEELRDLERACTAFDTVSRALHASDRPVASSSERATWLRAEERFHELILRAAHNPWLTKIAVELRLVSSVFAAHLAVDRLVTAAVAEKTRREHARLLATLTSRDAAAAAAEMRQHIQNGRRHVLELFTEPGGEAR